MVSSRAPQRPKRAPWRMKIATTAITLIVASMIAVSLDEVALQPAASPTAGAQANPPAQSWGVGALLASWEGGSAAACAPAPSLH